MTALTMPAAIQTVRSPAKTEAVARRNSERLLGAWVVVGTLLTSVRMLTAGPAFGGL
jgi:hypothetical protein